jgi:D-tagatose-1,6-bisphosphate aldolase subunit GatZ/KbaZ
LTFAYREAVFALSMIEDELIPVERRSHLRDEIENEMLLNPDHWQKYYTGTANEQASKRRYSLSDRVRYYWVRPKIQAAIHRLFLNLQGTIIPMGLASQFSGRVVSRLQQEQQPITADHLVAAAIDTVLEDYQKACTPS